MNINLDQFIVSCISKTYPDIGKLIALESVRQRDNIELIASENFASDEVKLVEASCFINKYAEGYPTDRKTGQVGRYYEGCENIDKLEQLCCDEWQQAFHTDYHVNVQPASGSHANEAAYQAVLKEGDTILSMNMDGGHLTHSSPVSFVSMRYKVITYGVIAEGKHKGYIDMDEVERLAKENHPKLILAGASAYSREIDFDRFRKIADSVGAYFMVDMAHIAGLVAVGLHKSPFYCGADIVTTTTQKTLGGPRGGLIFCKPELAKKVDSAVFPGTAGGPAMNIIAAKAICAKEVQNIDFAIYAKQVVDNCKVFANEFKKMGYDVVTGGTDNHLFMIDFSKTHPDITGKGIAGYLNTNGITLNANKVPGDKRGPKLCSGVRIGTAAMTRKGWGPSDFIELAHRMDELIKDYTYKTT